MIMSIMNETEIVTYESIQCFRCEIKFFVPATFKAQRLNDGGEFHCPNGHGQAYTESTKKKLESANANLQAVRAQLSLAQDQRAAAEQRLSKLKERVKSGVCPFCNRTFSCLQRHMESKHKGHAVEKK